MDESTHIEYTCPFCPTTKDTESSIRRHIATTADDAHAGIDYDTDRTIETVAKNPMAPDEPRSALEQKFRKAARLIADGTTDYDAVNREAIEAIAAEAGTHHSHVCRVFDDHDIEYQWSARSPRTHADELTDNQVAILEEYHQRGRPDLPEPTRGRTSGHGIAPHTAIAKALGTQAQTVRTTLEKYGWLIDYDTDAFATAPNATTETGSETVEGVEDAFQQFINDSDDAAPEGDSTVHISDSDIPMATADTSSTESTHERINKLEDAGVDISIKITIEDDDFIAIKKLIQAGHDDLAETLFGERI